MQAPLSSTASGQHFRTGPPSGLPPLWDSNGPTLELEGRREGMGRRVRAGVATVALADGPGLAHDAGNLLGALRLYCDLLGVPGVLREEHRHYAEELQLLSKRSGALIDRLLNPATTRRADVPEEQVILPEVIEQCRGLLSRIAHRAVEVTYGAEAMVPVTVAREAIERILVNLTKNAAEASASGGAIRLRVCRVQEGPLTQTSNRTSPNQAPKAQTHITLSVEDQGCGMSVAAVKVLLGDATAVLPQPKEGHHGLGLRVVRELVRESCGELRLKSRSGCGTTVEIAWAVAGEASVSTHKNNGTEGGVSC